MTAQHITLQFVPIQGASVGEATLLVRQHASPIVPTLYADGALTTPLANPLPVDSTGNVDFWVADDSLTYDGTLSGGNVVGDQEYINLASLGPILGAIVYQPRYFTIDFVPQPSGSLGEYATSVTNAVDGSYAALYEDEALTIPKANPFITTDINLSFWVQDRSVAYNINLSGGYLLAPQTIQDIWSLPAPIWANRAVYWDGAPEEWAYVNPYNVAVTSPSEDASWTPNFAEIIEEACERAGFEIRTGYQFRSARRSLNILFQEWANRGINLWTVEEGEIILNYGQGTYNLPADTVDIIEHVVRQNQGNAYNQVDIVIPRIALPTYAAIPNKLATGRPTQVYVNRQAPVPQINVWPTPNQTGYIFKYWRLRRIKDAANPGYQTADVPFRFVPALIAGLAYHVAVKNPPSADRISMLKAIYDEEWKAAADEDRDKAPIRFVPMAGMMRGR